ncbi:phosphotransferase enzyme family protein [Sarocladium implicatum]|nr:phosphotransferase enzyme family protein [Sarocladium implicatum]
MPPKGRFVCIDKDDLVWEKLDHDTELWSQSARTSETYRAVANFILKYRHGEPEVMHIAVMGGYNTIYRLEYKDGTSALMRVPIKGVVRFPEEKVAYEVATMRHVAAHTSIPVPHIYHHGTAAENPTGLGPFIIMDYIDHDQNMSRELLDPDRGIDERPVLNPNITDDKLELLYRQMANILLQLSHLKFPRIGSLVEDGSQSIASVKGRPLTANMNDIVTYDSANEWYSSLGDMHMIQLALQHNDAIEDEDDARDKYVARQLFRNLAKEKRLAKEDNGFRLFSEDLRPANVLLDKDLKVVGVIDWEFAYAAPAQFSFHPPWWLLLLEPDSWPGGYREWMKVYEPRLQTFLRVLEAEEAKMVNTSQTDDLGEGETPLSQRMRESWENKTWLLNYAARKSWAFDFIWWKFLDESFFGPNEYEDHRGRIELLSEAQGTAMERFVVRKLEESRNRRIVEYTDDEASERLTEVLI